MMCASLLAGSVVTRAPRLVFVGDAGAETAYWGAYSLIDRIERTTYQGATDHGVPIMGSESMNPWLCPHDRAIKDSDPMIG